MTHKAPIRLGIGLFWLAAMLCLARYEAFPELFTRSLRGYRGVLSDNVLMQESWARILVDGVPAGYSHTSMNVNDEDAQPDIEINNRTHLKATLMGQPLSFHVRTTLLLDPDYDLVEFESAVSAQGTTFRVKGQRKEGRQYAVATTIGDSTTHQTIEIPKDVLLYSPLSALALRQLRLGQELTIKTLDPLSMTTARIQVKAIAHETIQVAGKPVAATRLASRYHGIQLLSWIDKNGTLLRQETPMGWLIEDCTADVALRTVTDDHVPPDLITQGSGTGLLQLILAGKKDTSHD